MGAAARGARVSELLLQQSQAHALSSWLAPSTSSSAEQSRAEQRASKGGDARVRRLSALRVVGRTEEVPGVLTQLRDEGGAWAGGRRATIR